MFSTLGSNTDHNWGDLYGITKREIIFTSTASTQILKLEMTIFVTHKCKPDETISDLIKQTKLFDSGIGIARKKARPQPLTL